MLEQLLTYLHNWFRVRDSVNGKHPGTYTVENNGIVLPFLQEGQYFRIMGSIFNDGLYIYGESITDESHNEAQLHDETFDGSVWALAIPKAVIELSKEIAAWQEKYGATVANPYSSESFSGVYSYTKATIADASSGSAAAGWEGAFKHRLNQWRKIMED